MKRFEPGHIGMSDLATKREELLAMLRSFESCVVALSAGVDSAVMAKAAFLALGEKAIAVTGTSSSLASGELEAAQSIAAQIGIRHASIATSEFAQPAYLQNAPDRCYHCKTELYSQLSGLAEKFGMQITVNGVNADDLGDYRPGLQAAAEHDVRAPLAECGITKNEVRQLAAEWDLPVWDKPASPCLSSRVAYGEEVSPERLAMIDQAEQYLRSLGLKNVRVRYHRGDLARVEVPTEALSMLAEEQTRTALTEHLRTLGFKFITLDLEGFRSGSLNELVPLEILSPRE